MELTPEERERILTELHEREFLEREASTQERAARQQQAELEYRQSLADAARRSQQEHGERLENNLTNCIELIQGSLEAFREGDKEKCYRLLVKTDSFFISAKQQVNQLPERPIGGSVPVVRVKASNLQGWAIINAEDLTAAHEVLEDA